MTHPAEIEPRDSRRKSSPPTVEGDAQLLQANLDGLADARRGTGSLGQSLDSGQVQWHADYCQQNIERILARHGDQLPPELVQQAQEVLS